MARGFLGGMLGGGLVSILGLATASLLAEQPAGNTPPAAPLVQAPEVIEDVEAQAAVEEAPAVSTPVGSLEIEAPQAPDLPEGEQASAEPSAPELESTEPVTPRADTDPLDEPEVVSIEGAMAAPDAPDGAGLSTDLDDPVLPNPQGLAPQTPVNETDLTVSTAPAEPTIVVEPEAEVVVQDAPEPIEGEGAVVDADEAFVVDLGAQDNSVETQPVQEDDAVLADAGAQEATGPRLQLQGGENSLLDDRDTGVTIRRPASDAPVEDASAEAQADVAGDALTAFAADPGDVGSKPLLSIVLIDDGSMSAASAALAGLPFPVTIALDPSLEGAGEMMASYREDGFEVAVMAMLPEGALPSDVEITFESVFSTLPETVAVLDIGSGGLQTDRAVTEQAMDILAAQGRGFVTVSQGLNMAGRAADQAGVPAAVVYRDLDSDGQDARVVRRFVDQAAFRARQESGVVLVGRVRPDTISALILWGTANQDGQVAIVPVSAVLQAQ